MELASLYGFFYDQLNSHSEARELSAFVANLSPREFSVASNRKLNTQEEKLAYQLVHRRKKGEPLQYILGIWEFYSLPFYVGEGVLIPRQDTETLVDVILAHIGNGIGKTVLDLCAGSGTVAIAVSKNSDAIVTAVEYSEKAYGYLEKNIALNDANVAPILGDVTTYEPTARFDVIVSNPPYIPTNQLEGLQLEVQREPSMALDGGEDGLYFYKTITARYKDSLNPNGLLAFEIGIGQQEQLSEILLESGFSTVSFYKDLVGIIRVVTGKF